MADFINTIDRLGDDAVIDSIIDRSITEFKDDQVTKVGQYAFHSCTALTEVDLPTVTSLGQYAFYGCSALTEINIPGVTTINPHCFQNCTSLKSISLPELTTMFGNNVYLGAQFSACTSLESIILPKLQKLGFKESFTNCDNLEYADFTDLIWMGAGSFNYCPKHKILILRNTQTVVTLNDRLVFRNSPIASGTGYIYVPRALIEDYKVATNWSTYAAQFRALEDYTVDGTITGELDETKI